MVIAQCPECQTKFKVAPDQIRLSDGWARCGRCLTVFDVLQYQVAQEEAPAAASPVAALPEPSHPTQTPRAQHEDALTAFALAEERQPASLQSFDEGRAAPQGAPLSVDVELDVAPELEQNEAHLSQAAAAAPLQSDGHMAADFVAPQHDAAWGDQGGDRTPQRGAAVAGAFAQAVQRDPVWDTPSPAEAWAESAPPEQAPYEAMQTNDHVPSAVSEGEQADEVQDAGTVAQAAFSPSGHHEDVPQVAEQAEGQDEAQAAAAPLASAPSFVRQAERAARWRRPWVRALLLLLSVLLLLALALQWVWIQRDHLAAKYPAQRPLLQSMCEALGCDLLPWEAASALRVEATSFNKLSRDRYRFRVHLSNRESVPIASPHVLLVLRDGDQVDVMRRYFTPAELGLPSSTISPGEEYQGVALLELTRQAGALDIQGYEVELFYPH